MGSVEAAKLSVDLADDVGLLLVRAGTVTRLRMVEALAPLGVTMRQFAVLRALEKTPALSQAQLGERLQIDPSSIVAVLDSCQDAGWIERRASPADRRRYSINLTPAGRKVLLGALTVASEVEDRLFASLDDEQRNALRDLLVLIVESAPAVSSQPPKVGRREG